jgi:hypothetical protein
LASRQRYGAGDVIHIPTRSGGADIFAEAFKGLESSQLALDQRSRLAAVVMAHASDNEIDSRWLASSLASSDIRMWVKIGSFVGALQRVDKDVVLKRIGSADIAKTIPILSSVGRFDCILTSEANASLLWYQFLARGPDFIRHELGEPPFFLIPILIGPDQYGPVWYHRRPDIEQAIQAFATSSKQEELPEQFRLKFVHECYDISKKILESLGSSKLGVDVLEACRRTWGAKPAILNGALRMLQYQNLPRSKIAHFSLVDSDEAMVSRLKAARTRRNELNWWRAQLAEAKGLSFSTRLFVTMACFNLATESVLHQSADQIAEGLDALSSEEWSTTVQLVSTQIDRISFSSKAERSAAVAQSRKSYRFSYLIALKSSRATARKLFLQNLLEQPDENLPIADFRQLFALDAGLAGELEWPRAMKIVRETYAQGAAYRLRRLLVPSGMLPEAVADEILLKPMIYPAALWDFAEIVASDKARKAVRAVGPIARAEKWFAN